MTTIMPIVVVGSIVTDWITSARVEAFSALTTAAVTIILVWLTTRQLRASDLDRKHRLKPALAFQFGWRTVFGQITVRNLGPGAAINCRIEPTPKHEAITLYDQRDLFPASLEPGQGAVFEIRAENWEGWFSGIVTGTDVVSLMEVRVTYEDTLSRKFDSAAELIYDLAAPTESAIRLISHRVGNERDA